MKYLDLFILLGHSMLLCVHVGYMSILMDGMNISVRCSTQVVSNVLRVYNVNLILVFLVDEGLNIKFLCALMSVRFLHFNFLNTQLG